MIETDRLALRELDPGRDAAFILRLTNEPSWLEHIGDRGIRTLDDARDYIQNGPMRMYARLGFGLYLVELKGTGEPLGICGLVRREGLDDVDLGFAFLPEHWSHGYARESAAAVLDWAHQRCGLERIVAITTAGNHPSMKLLDRLGFVFERTVQLRSGDPELRLYAWTSGQRR